jgi:Cu/Ag efflux pump CusA
MLGEYAARQAGQRRLLALSALALIGILLVLYTDFRSGRLTTLVFASLPFALVGGVAAAFLTGGVLSLGSLVGFVTVLGMAARNGVMLVSHYRHLEEQELAAFGREMIVRGAEERLVPILMTASATALALLPIIIGGNRPGHEIEHPMAASFLCLQLHPPVQAFPTTLDSSFSSMLFLLMAASSFFGLITVRQARTRDGSGRQTAAPLSAPVRRFGQS